MKLVYLTACLLTPLLGAYPEVYFSPDDNVREKLLSFIRQEKESIKAALYFLTDRYIIDALGKAKKEGVDVEIVIDKGNVENEWSRVRHLNDYGIPVYVYDGKEVGIMHNKFFVFGRNKQGKKLLWTGSYNPTRRATKFNRENVVVEESASIIHSYEREYNRIKRLAKPFARESKKKRQGFSFNRFIEERMHCKHGA